MVDFVKALLASDYYLLIVPVAWLMGWVVSRGVRLAWLWWVGRE